MTPVAYVGFVVWRVDRLLAHEKLIPTQRQMTMRTLR